MLQGGIFQNGGPILGILVVPGRVVIGTLGRIVSREQAVLEIKSLCNQIGSIGIGHDIFFMIELVLNNIIYHAAQECDISPGAHRAIQIGNNRGAGVTGIDMDYLSAAYASSFAQPFHPDGVVFRHVAAHDKSNVSIF